MAQEIQVIGLTFEELQRVIKLAVAEGIRESRQIHRVADEPLTLQQACRILNISAPTLRKYVAMSLIRRHSLGPRRKVFYLNELEEDIKNLPSTPDNLGD